MGISPNFTNKDFDKLNQKIIDDTLKKCIQAYLILGESVISHAKDSVGFTDQSGNLRSSIGYVLFVNGQVYREFYEGKAVGTSEGKQFARELASKAKRAPIVLVFTAGMNYAYSVESRGYNVLAASENYAKQAANLIIKQMIK
ncbi:Uncharacterised protein [Algoriella xinjiangensis]|uniref:hypothetical protein n=1 Tax=Algoriella xinjiangensis TaxID=684065 RepID=UPI000F634E5E|nr:hypothetical protein [Algoriella xinjiangensis]VDH16109.1 Uncharacterised protein [Algoriella xinjiangensis]